MTAAPRDMEREKDRRRPPTSSPIDTEPAPAAPTSKHTRSNAPELSRVSTAIDDEHAQLASATHQRFVLTDNVAARYLEEDAAIQVLSRREKIEGYEIYLVEQWACSRIHPTFIITHYTGDPKDVVYGHVLSVPKDETQWSPQLRTYFRALDQFHARRRETSLGTIMVTNLSSFPSSLTIIPVPEGDLKKSREYFFVNENLKRLGCSGRTGIKLATPSGATRAKFHQLYRTSDKIPLNSSVIELVKLCQVALVLFGKLEPEYADGLLCDVTEKAINDWWVEFGNEYYTVEPHDGILGPTTVAALLGMLMGARNRLRAYNAPISKDVFNIESTRRGISYFQKDQRIAKTRQFDRQTLERLRRATAKAASKESWAVPRAFKGAVAELGGKGGEMVMGMVGAGEKAGIADIETTDIDRFVELVSGERSKWLWHGKPRKTGSVDMFSRLPREERSVSPNERGTTHIASLIKRESTLEGHSFSARDSRDVKRTDTQLAVDGYDREKDPNSKRAAIKRATERIETGSGFHRIKDVVGRRNHPPKPSKDDLHLQHTKSDLWPVAPQSGNGPITSKTDDPKQNQDTRREALAGRRTVSNYDPKIAQVLTETPTASASTLDLHRVSGPHFDGAHESTASTGVDEQELFKTHTAEPSIAGSVYHGIDLNDKLPCDETQNFPPLLRRTQSNDQLDPYHRMHRNDDWWPRHLSFSIAQESVLRWEGLVAPDPVDPGQMQNLPEALATTTLGSEEAKRLHHKIALLSSLDAQWATSHISTITSLDSAAEQDTLQLESLYYPALDSYQSLREDVHEIISSNRALLQEQVRDLTMLSDKLEYEIGSLRSKVDDLEEGVEELERLVEGLESRVDEGESLLGSDKEGWFGWALRIVTGF
ncbi:hypothetical protein P171DRAFT_427005 [Karstenula rhodostoma CBS 690.94]|uniref:STB6-like N-terminal domain-containing protein n=1 Tax=Karstenula rhodostoma CBS 690.94 TaxID=1392251 RepID=A0A9P4UII7_9PLEO|nr:hypothetical protein P171DRAFT_427005 [Karstenula rhodostoma CBS 690.94]